MSLCITDVEEQAIFEEIGENPVESAGGFARNSKIRLSKFFDLLHGQLPPLRERIIQKAFMSLSGEGETPVKPSTLKECYNADAHPQVARGELNAADVHAEFLHTFSLLVHARSGCEDGLVHYSDFLEYYRIVSYTIDNDTWFELLLSKLWSVPEEISSPRGRVTPRSRADPDLQASPMAERKPPAFDGPSAYATGNSSRGETHRRFVRKLVDVDNGSPKASVADVSPITKSNIIFNETCSSELTEVILRLRSSVNRRGLKGWRSLEEHFHRYDGRKNGTIARLDWDRMHKNMGLGLSPEEREGLFKCLSQGRRDCAMDFVKCLRLVKVPLTDQQASQVTVLFQALQERDRDVVLPSVCKQMFAAKNTQPCMLGKRRPNDVQQEFCDVVDYFGNNGFDLDTFLDFFGIVAMCCADQDEFRLMTTAAFGLPMDG